MNKETELTIKLRNKGIWCDYTYIHPEHGRISSWTIESGLKWLREKGWICRIVDFEDEGCLVGITKHRPFLSHSYMIGKGHELEGLLECMIKIMEGESK